MAVLVHLSLMAHLHAHVRLASLAKSVNRILASQIHALTVVHALRSTRPASTVHVLVIPLDLIARILILVQYFPVLMAAHAFKMAPIIRAHVYRSPRELIVNH